MTLFSLFTFFGITIWFCIVHAANFCGNSWTDAKKCLTSCPNGQKSECTGNESCFADVVCSNQRNFCGNSFADSSKCRTSCPRGVDSECQGTERCFARVTCSSSPSGPTRPQTSPPTRPPPSGSGSAVSRQQFNSMFPSPDPLYTYNGFIAAARNFPSFMRTGSLNVRRREAAAFFANIAHESCNLGCTVEQNTANYNSYCDPATAIANGFTSNCDKNGKRFQYYGRGPIQLSWNYNYKAAGDALRIDLLNNPDRVATNSATAWGTAIWFWMTSRGAGQYTPHVAITSGRGFGETIRAINGALECGGRAPAKVTRRVDFYRKFVRELGTTTGDGNVRC